MAPAIEWGSVDYAYKRVREGSFRETMEAVERAARARGFLVCQIHDISGALAAKGFPIRPLSIIELAPEEDRDDPTIELLMPVKVNVYEEGGQVWVAALRPTPFCHVYPEHELDTVAERLETDIVGLVDLAVSSV